MGEIEFVLNLWINEGFSVKFLWTVKTALGNALRQLYAVKSEG